MVLVNRFTCWVRVNISYVLKARVHFSPCRLGPDIEPPPGHLPVPGHVSHVTRGAPPDAAAAGRGGVAGRAEATHGGTQGTSLGGSAGHAVDRPDTKNIKILNPSNVHF